MKAHSLFLIGQVDESIELYKKLWASDQLSEDEKVNVLSMFLSDIPDEGLEILDKLRDSLQFIKGNEQETTVTLLHKICSSPQIDSYQRLICALSLYNNGYIFESYELFAYLANDTNMNIKYRVESSRYLFSTEIDEHVDTACKVLKSLISENTFSSEARYRIIASFISKTGLYAVTNSKKLRVKYNEKFVCELQKVFFWNKNNGVRERILSGQFLLSIDNIKKDEIVNSLMQIARDETEDYNVRADAADVVFRMGEAKQKKAARCVITELGNADPKKMKTIYSDSQNVHDEKVAECVELFTEQMFDSKLKQKSFDQVHTDVSQLIRTLEKISDRQAAYKSLDRISLDTATFGKYKITIAEVLVNVWSRICSYSNSDEHKLLKERLLEELQEMKDTCSSGHVTRLINVLSIVDNTITISWKSQIHANISGRMNAKIRNLEDTEKKEAIVLGMMENADSCDQQAYDEFVAENINDIYEELKTEFVGGKYVSQEEFDEIFSQFKLK